MVRDCREIKKPFAIINAHETDSHRMIHFTSLIDCYPRECIGVVCIAGFINKRKGSVLIICTWLFTSNVPSFNYYA